MNTYNKLNAIKEIIDNAIDELDDIANDTKDSLRSGRIILSECLKNIDEPANDIAHIAAILSNYYTDMVYNSRNGFAFLRATETIVEWAIEFHTTYKNVNWEQLLDDPEGCGFSKNICSWDEAIVEFGYHKMSEIDSGFDRNELVFVGAKGSNEAETSEPAPEPEQKPETKAGSRKANPKN